MEDFGLKWSPRKCAVVHVRKGVYVTDASGVSMTRILCLEKSLTVVESLVQEEKIAPECAAKEHLRRLSVIWWSPFSDYNRVKASSNQFALPALGYLMWMRHWPVTELKIIDRETRKIVGENGVDQQRLHICQG